MATDELVNNNEMCFIEGSHAFCYAFKSLTKKVPKSKDYITVFGHNT